MSKIYLCMESDADCCGTHSWVIKVFNNKDAAERYCKDQDLLNDFGSFYVQEMELEEVYDFVEIRPYYSFYIGLDEEVTDIKQAPYWLLKDFIINKGIFNEVEFENLENELVYESYGLKQYDKVSDKILSILTENDQKELLYYINDPDNLYDNDIETENRPYTEDIIIDKTEDYIQVYSVNSFEETKKVALELLEKEKTNG